jgi:cation-transporting ATPase 13A3/4/5
LGNWQYLFQDLFLVFPLTIFMGATHARRDLSAKRPSGNLLSVSNVVNLLTHMGIVMAWQLATYHTISAQPDYVKLDNPENGPWSYNTTALYYFSNFCYLVVAVLFAQGAPWKASFLTNWQFSAWMVVGLCASSALLLSPYLEPAFFRSDDVPLPWSWRRTIGAYALLYAACAVGWETIVFPLLRAVARRWARQGRAVGTVFGRTKPLDGSSKNVKLYHRMRGEFEANWAQANYY